MVNYKYIEPEMAKTYETPLTGGKGKCYFPIKIPKQNLAPVCFGGAWSWGFAIAYLPLLLP